MRKIGVGLAGAMMLATGANQLQEAVKEQKSQGERGRAAAKALNASVFIASAQALHALTAPTKKRVKPDFSALAPDDRSAAESSYAEVEHKEALADHARQAANVISGMAALIPDTDSTLSNTLRTVNSMHTFLRNTAGLEKKAASVGECDSCKQTKELQENGKCNDCNARAAGVPAEVENKCPDCGERKHLQSNGKCNACNEVEALAVQVYQEGRDRLDAKQRAEEKSDAEPDVVMATARHFPNVGHERNATDDRVAQAVQVATITPAELGRFYQQQERFRQAPVGDRPDIHWHGPRGFTYNVNQAGAQTYTIQCNGSVYQWTGLENRNQICGLCRVPGCAGTISEKRAEFNLMCAYLVIKVYQRRAEGSTIVFASIVASSRASWHRPDFRLTAVRIAEHFRSLSRYRPTRTGVTLTAVAVAGAAAAAFGAYKLRQSDELEEARANFMRITRAGVHRAGLHDKAPHPECDLCKERTKSANAESRGKAGPETQAAPSLGPGAPPPWLQKSPQTKVGGGATGIDQSQDKKTKASPQEKGGEAIGLVTAASLALGAVGAAATTANVVGNSKLEESVRKLAQEVRHLRTELSRVKADRDEAVTTTIEVQKDLNKLTDTNGKLPCKYGERCTNNTKRHAEKYTHFLHNCSSESMRWAEMPSRGKNKGGRGTQKRAARAATSQAKKGKMIKGVWYDEDPAEAGQRIWLSAGEIFEEVRYGSDRMHEILREHGQHGAQYVVPEGFHDYDGEAGFTMTFKTRGGVKEFNVGTDEGRRAAMAHMLRNGADTRKITARDASGHIHRPGTLSFRTSAAGPSVRVQHDETGEYKGRTSGFGTERDLERMMAPVRGPRWDEVEDEAESKGQKASAWRKNTTTNAESENSTETRAVLKDGPGFDAKGNWCFICRACRKQASFMRSSVERARDKYGDDWIAPSTCYQCHQARIRFEQGVKLTGTPPEYKVQKKDVKPRDTSTEPKEPVSEKKATVPAESAIQTGQPADIAAAMATLPKDATVAVTVPQSSSISKADFGVVSRLFKPDKKKAESIQAANPITYVDIATKTGRVVAKFFREKLGKATPEISSGFATEHWFVCTQHGTKYSEERIEAHYGHNYGMKHMAYDPNADTAHHGTPIPGTDLMIFPRPQAMKWFNLAKPIQGQPVFVWPSHRAERGHGFGHVLALGVDTEYKDGQGHIWQAPALAAANYESEGGCSGMPVCNSRGEVVGVHVTSDGTPGSPAYFVPMTDELITLLKTPPKPLNSIAGSSITQVQSRRV